MPIQGLIRQHVAALRALLVLTVVCGIAYPLAVTALAQLPGLRSKADGSMLTTTGGKFVGSAIIGQLFTDAHGKPLVQYFQSRPSAAGAGYDPTSTSASNLGPDDIVDTLADPADKSDTGTQSLLTQVCARSLAVGRLNGVSGARPYCTATGVGAVLAVFGPRNAAGAVSRVTQVVSINQQCPAKPFMATYRGVRVRCASYAADYRDGQIIAIRGDAGPPAVPPDAVTASASGLDPDISVAYAQLQATRVASTRGVSVEAVDALIRANTTGQFLGFIGEPAVNVLTLNLALDATYPYSG